MLIYLISFITSLFFLIFGERTRGILKYALFLIGGSLTICLAAFRSENIGDDLQVYIIPLYNCGERSNDFIQFFNSSRIYNYQERFVADIDIGFSLISYIFGHYSLGLKFYLFTLNFLVEVPLIFALINFSKKFNITNFVSFGFAVFSFLFFNLSLNIIRQLIASSFALLSFSFFINKKYIKAFLFLILAFFFHSAILVLILVFLFYLFFSSDSFLKSSRLFKITVSLILILIFLIFLLILSKYGKTILISLGLNRFTYYLSDNFNFSVNQLIIRIPVLCLSIFALVNTKLTRFSYFIFFIVAFDILIGQMASMSEATVRISYMFQYFYIFFIPYLYNIINFKYKKIILLLIFIYLIIFWLYFYCYKNIGNTLPYEMRK